jgi:predicted O-linked N-acetylglucosamine transferase (SPINDLY family)/glycosyltransferase involved in cell wall biosynthesis
MNRHEAELREAAGRDDWKKAVAAGRAWTRAEPKNALAQALLGYAAERAGDDTRAEAAYAASVALAPRDADVRANLSAALARLGRFDEAAREAERALALAPGHVLATDIARKLAGPRAAGATERGRALAAKGDASAALIEFEIAARLLPDDGAAQLNLGRIRRRLGDADGANAAFRAAEAADPDDPMPLAERLMLARDLADWRETDALEAELRIRVDGGAVLPPFVGFFLDLDSSQARALAERWARRQAPVTRATPAPRKGGDRLRVGYLSEHFRRHATTHLIAEVLERHDPSKVEVFLYSYGPDDRSAERARIAKTGDFVDLSALDDDAAARRIADDGLDVLVDLMGYVEKNRFGIVRRKPAPIVVEWLGYPATTGDTCVDWVFADETTIPPGGEADWSERVWRLPDSYQPNDRNRPVAAPPTRAQAGLPAGGFVFACFNHAWKLTPSVFDAWLRILAAVPESVLWLLDGAHAANLRGRAAARGLDPARLVFAPPLPLDRHLARLSLADLALDAAPYGMHTTASDALWVGVPILTAPRASFPSRVAASLARAAGQVGGIVTPDTYEAEAIALAREPARLAASKAGISRGSPLFDADAMARALETAYAKMRDGVAAPTRIEVKPTPLDLCFVDASTLDFRPDTPDRRALGGSQSGFCYLARRLAARGHRVMTLTGTREPGAVDGVTALGHDDDAPRHLAGRRFDAVIALNDASVARAFRAALAPGTPVILWTQHAHDQPAMLGLKDRALAAQWRAIVAISDWHRGKLIETFGLDPARVRVRRNAIAPVFETLARTPNPGPARLVYTSTPFRGLDVLLGVFPRLREMFPGTTLDVFSSLAVYQVAAKDDPFGSLYERARATPGVAMRGSVPQAELAAELARADVLAYPSTFAETGCIAAMEALAAGLDVVSSRLGALPEATMGFGKLAAIDPVTLGDEAFARHYLDTLSAALDLRARARAEWDAERAAAARAMRSEGNWSARAIEWERSLFELVQASAVSSSA